MALTPNRERTITVVSAVVTLVVLAGYVAFANGPISTRIRGMIGVDSRLAPAVQVEGAGSFAFLNTQPGGERPVGFSPCTTIRFVVNPEHAPADWEDQVATAVAEIEARTGLVFEYEGTSEDRDFGERTGTTGRPQPVLIGWADDEEVPDLAGPVAGLGGPTMVELGNLRGYVTGSVVLDFEVTDEYAEAPGGERLQLALLLHELGHLVGLDHVDDPNELMYGEGVTRTDFGPGDRQGLARLGDIPCG